MKTYLLYDAFEENCMKLINEIIALKSAGKQLEAAQKNRDLALYRIDYYEQFLDEPYKPMQAIWKTQYDNAYILLGVANDRIYELENDF